MLGQTPGRGLRWTWDQHHPRKREAGLVREVAGTVPRKVLAERIGTIMEGLSSYVTVHQQDQGLHLILTYQLPAPRYCAVGVVNLRRLEHHGRGSSRAVGRVT